MEFKNFQVFSKLIEAKTEETRLIDEADVLNMLRNEYLHDQHSHFIVSAEGTYDDTRTFNYGIVPERIKLLEEAYKKGNTIVIKEVENWNEAIIKKCAGFKLPTNVHLYLSPPHASGFGWHTDDRDVYVIMQKGEKYFEVEEPDQSISGHLLKEGTILYIPYGARHRAKAGEKASVHLGFGVWPQDLTISKQYEIFDLPIDLKL
ncbi:JmjC domain-containing protein [Peredibacter starrii]|uniref:Cupin domain-containing protein n=1 Tax=Peredibacter starrii TaxID=28202 RepID=A0AAX4HQY2_9BACT|nr:cupin domain-containing protein [Peredibacter starrii]WPU65632.1 cupin domain-containing protein [Peredibacter starrii]